MGGRFRCRPIAAPRSGVSDHDLPTTAADGQRTGRPRVASSWPRSDHTVGELADALGMPRRAVVRRRWPAGRQAGPPRSGGDRQRQPGRRPPERMACCTERTGTSHVAAPGGRRLMVTVEAGPAAGATFGLPPGRHLIGRSAALRRAPRRRPRRAASRHRSTSPTRRRSASSSSRVASRAGPTPMARRPTSASPPPQTLPAGVGGHDRSQPSPSRQRRPAIRPTCRLSPGPRRPVAALAAPPATTAGRRGRRRRSRRRAPSSPVRCAPPAGCSPASCRSPVASVLAVVVGHPMYLIFSCLGLVAAVGSALGRRVRWRTAAPPQRRRHRRVTSSASPLRSPPSVSACARPPTVAAAPTLAAVLRVRRRA